MALLLLGALLLSAWGIAKERTHEVASGHTLWGIARRYGVSVDAIKARNELTSAKIRPGQRLIIPEQGWRPGDPTPSEKRGAGPAKPDASTQVQKTSAERGGINPCNTPDPGFGVYGHWRRGIAMGQWLAPGRGGITRSGQFDVMFHFHGHEPARKEWVRVMDGTVFVGVTLGTGSGAYINTFSNGSAFKSLVQSVEKAMATKTGKANARVRHVGLSAWSAGYGAVQQILQQRYGRELVDTVVLLDGLHCGYRGNDLEGIQLKPFVDFARRAARRQKYFFVSHSSIIPPGYASTTETANYLIRALGGRPRATRPRAADPVGLELVSRYGRGNFQVRGYAGNGPLDHCAHLSLYRDVLKVHVKRRWNSPRGYASRK